MKHTNSINNHNQSLGHQIGDFQANVGKFSAGLGVLMGWIFGIISILAGIGISIYGVATKSPPDDCPEAEDNAHTKVNVFCKGGGFAQQCKNAKEDLKKCKGSL